MFRIGNVPFGGQPGWRWIVLVGSLFYPGRSMVENRLHGDVNKNSLEKVLSDHH